MYVKNFIFTYVSFFFFMLTSFVYNNITFYDVLNYFLVKTVYIRLKCYCNVLCSKIFKKEKSYSMTTFFFIISICLCLLVQDTFPSNDFKENVAEKRSSQISMEHWNQQRSSKFFIRPFLDAIKSKLDLLNEKIGWKLNMTTNASTTSGPTTTSSTITSSSSSSTSTVSSVTTSTTPATK